jgi:hypothetical protein
MTEEGEKGKDSNRAVGRRLERGRGWGRKGRTRSACGGREGVVVGDEWRRGGGRENRFGIVGGEGDGDGALLVDGTDVKGSSAGLHGQGEGARISQNDRGFVCGRICGAVASIHV